ncbi:Hypothetical protein A7982_02513 [Minicystis rosea]|nr:Hypothetical protein A7982_02513 [Minicystis rosea]
MEETSPRLLSFDPKQEPSVLRHASTVVVVREGATHLEVFCVLRHAKSSFLGGAVVFPGGKVDAADAAEVWAAQATTPHPRTERMTTPFGGAAGGPPVTARALAVAACRETLEEAGIVPLVGDGAQASEPSRVDIAKLRAELAQTPGSLAQALARSGQRLALDALVPWARWVTPQAESRRFDARFFLLELPAFQEGRHDEHETTMSFWARPSAVLDRFMRGEIFLAPPTTRTLELLATVDSVKGAYALADAQSLLPVCPEFVAAEAPFLALPGDPAHSVRERRVEGPTRFVLRDGRFVGEDPPADDGGAPVEPGASPMPGRDRED